MHGADLTAVLPFTVLPCTVSNSYLGDVCYPLYVRDSLDWIAGARMDQC